MSKERETLITDLSINAVDGFFYITQELQSEIRELLAQPEQEPIEDRIARWHRLGYEQGKKASKREPLTRQQISEGNQSMFNVTREAFVKGVEWAEHQHGIRSFDDE